MGAILKPFSVLLNFARRIGLARVLTTAIFMTSILSAVVTYVVITNPDTFGFANDANLQSTLLIFNLGLLLFLAILVSRRLIHVWIASSKGKAGSRLLLKLVFMFSIVAIIPAIIVGVSSSFYLNLGIKSWFDERVSRAVVESVAVADAYLAEHKKIIKTDAVNLSSEIGSKSIEFAFNADKLSEFLTAQAGKRLLAEVIVFNEERVIASSRLGLAIDPLEIVVPSQIQRASEGDVIIVSEDGEKVSAISRIGNSKIGNLGATYLFVSRFVDAGVVAHTQKARGAAEEYLKLKTQIADIQIKSTVFFVIIALFLLLGALWTAINFASSLVQPISNLVNATDKIKKGEFTIRVKEEGNKNDEISVLSRAFNQMAAELESQKRGVIIANREAEDRQQFNEAVLSSISSGVIAIDADKKVTLLNISAKEYVSLGDNSVGKYLKDVMPEFFEVFEEFMQKPTKSLEKQIAVRRKTKRMTFNVRINPHLEKDDEGYVISFDDITKLLSAQRSAAWSDVAQRIAHEVRNPLTPINLSAQRLAKKFTKKLPEEEQETFTGYTNTIVRHTADIAKIIGEFSEFARLPGPKFSKVDLSPLLKDAVFSARVAHSEIDFSLDMPDEMQTTVDGGQISQVLTNVIKNAAESVSEQRKKGGKIKAKAEVVDEDIVITIEDNGGGFPEELLDRILEPYVTTRQKGTGLGLAIVKKIISDHNGKIELSNIRGGARVQVQLPSVV